MEEDRDDGPPEFGIGDQLAQRCGNTLTGVFVAGSGSKIALSAYRPVTWNTPDAPTENAGQDPVLIYMTHEATLYDNEPVLRSLLAEASATFNTLQDLQAIDRGEYMKISRAYRSIIRACLEKLEQVKKTPEVQTDKARLQRVSESIITFYAIECLWHLFEILFMQYVEGRFVVAQLLEWTRFHFPHTEDRATDLLLMAEEAGDCDDYWSVLKSLIMTGQVDVTRAILAQHRKAHREPFKAADLALKSMPVYQQDYALHKFRSQWDYWRVDVERKLSAGVFATEPELELLLQLVTGNNEQWDAALASSRDWYEFLPGYLFYTHPTCRAFELRMSTTSWLNRWSRLKPDWAMSGLSRMIKQLMDHDLKVFIYEIQKLGDSHWFATHLLDLVKHSGEYLVTYCEKNRIDLPLLRQTLVYEFGSYLMVCNNLWQLGVDYLTSCNDEGYAAIELLLPRIPLKTEKQALKIIRVARSYGFTAVEQEICKVLSKRSYDARRYGNALEWAIRSKDTLLVTAITDFILNHYSETGVMLCPDVLTSIGGRMFVSPRLVFLAKYFEFYEYYRKRDFLPAAELLVNLLESKITPDYFWPSLLLDAMPLLESKDPKIFSKETVAILHHLETELVPLIERNKLNTATFQNQTSKTILKDYRVENVEEILDLLRLACARNLARALVIENTGPMI